MKKFGRHIRLITSLRDIIEVDPKIIDDTCDRYDPYCIIEMNKNTEKDDIESSSDLVFSQMFSGIYVTFLSLCAIVNAIWTFITFILIPTLRDNVLPILCGLTKLFINIIRFIFEQIRKVITNTTKHYRNNTTNWP